MELDLNWDNIWIVLIIMLIFFGTDIPNFQVEELKRYAELAGTATEEPQELEDKKPQG